MAAALGGVLAYVGCGFLGFIGAPRLFSWLALFAGSAAFLLWVPGFPEALLGGLPWGIAVVGDMWAVGMWTLGLVLHATVLLHARRPGAFHPLATILIGTCLAGSLSRDLFNLYVLMELSSLLALVLIGTGRRVRAVWAGLRYLVLTEVGLTLYLFGLGLVYGKMGTLSITALAAGRPDLSDPTLAVGVGLLLAGAAVKTGVFVLGLWLPQAHGQAPTEVSVLLSGIVVKVGVVAMARLGEAFPVGALAVGTWAIVGLPPLAGFAAKGVLAQGAPARAKGAFYALGLGTAASFSKLIPLLGPRGAGPWPWGNPPLRGAPLPAGVGRGDPGRRPGVRPVPRPGPGSSPVALLGVRLERGELPRGLRRGGGPGPPWLVLDRWDAA